MSEKTIRKQIRTLYLMTTVGYFQCAERCGGIGDTVQHHFGRRKTGIKPFVPVLLQTVIRKCLPCAGCKVIAERTASESKRRCGKAGGKNHQRTGNQALF